MKLCGRDALDGLADGVNDALAGVASAAASALEEAYGNIRILEGRIAELERNAVGITRSADNKLEIGLAVGAGESGKGNG